MKNILIIGVTGTFGKQMAQTLMSSGFAVKALMRDPRKIDQSLKNIELIQGDVNVITSVRNACKDVDIIVYGVNPPYEQWATYAEPYLNNVAVSAEEMKLTIIFPGNIYAIDPMDGTDFNEGYQSEKPPTKKGIIRSAMESRLKEAATKGAKVIVLRMGDFIAVESASPWLSHIVKPNKNGYSVLAPGDKSIKHTWAYVPVAVVNALLINSKLKQLPNFNVFNFKGYQISIEEIADSVQEVINKPVKIKAFPWLFIKAGSLFSKNLKELLEMRYLWGVEVNLNDQKIRGLLGESYPLETALKEALKEVLMETKSL